jgi:hypothetical protein
MHQKKLDIILLEVVLIWMSINNTLSLSIPNYAILACRFAKEGLMFCEENAIPTFRSIIIY